MAGGRGFVSPISGQQLQQIRAGGQFDFSGAIKSGMNAYNVVKERQQKNTLLDLQKNKAAAAAEDRKKANERADRKSEIAEEVYLAQKEKAKLDAAETKRVSEKKEKILSGGRPDTQEEWFKLSMGLTDIGEDKAAANALKMGDSDGTIFGSGGGTKQAEDIVNLVKSGVKNEEWGTAQLISLAESRSGTALTEAQQATQNRADAARKDKKLSAVEKFKQKQWDDYSDRTKSLDETLVGQSKIEEALRSGDSQTADKIITQVLSQLSNTNVRAVKMYDIFDDTTGNLYERTVDGLTRWASGQRAEGDMGRILNDVKSFADGVSRVKQEIMTRKRDDIRKMGKNPWSVFPPTSASEVKAAYWLDDKEKIKLIKENNLKIK